MEIVNERLDERPQIKLAPLQFDSDFGLEVGVFLEYLADKGFELLHAPTQRLQHLGGFGAGAARQCHFQDSPRERNGTEWCPQIVRHKGEILFTSALHLQSALSGIGL